MDEDSKIQLEQAAISVKNAVFSNIPVVGSILDEVLFEHRSRVKQERLNRFVEEFEKYLRSMRSCDIDQKHLKSEEFGDIFESILRRVVNTASEEKVHRFKKILLNEMEHSDEYFTIREIEETHGVVYQTARADLLRLTELGYLKKEKRGREFMFIFNEKCDLWKQGGVSS